MREYQYFLYFDDLNPVEVFPVWGSGQNVATTKETDQQFTRDKLTGAFTFARNDFDILYAADIETKFSLWIYRRDRYTTNDFELDTINIFYKTDFQAVDPDKRSLKVEPDTQDDYKLIIEKLDKEFDLIQLAPPVHDLHYFTQPVFQIVCGGQTVLTNVLAGVSFEQDLTTIPLGGGDLTTNYNFGYLGGHGIAMDNGMGLDVSGEYVTQDSLFVNRFVRKADGLYIIVPTATGTYPDVTWEIRLRATDEILFITTDTGPREGIADFVFYEVSGDGEAVFSFLDFYGRLLTNSALVGASATSLIPEDDIIPPPVNYTRVLAVGGFDFYGTPLQAVIISSMGSQEDPTPYKKVASTAYFNAGQYFTKPSVETLIHPISQRRWSQASFWLQYSDIMKEWQVDGAKENITGCYKLSEVIQVLLTAIGSTVTHEALPAYSQFLYNPVPNPIRQTDTVPVITPKALIIVGENQEPARQALIKLSDITNLLKIWKCSWHIQGGKFIIEADEYYHRGRSYDVPNVGLDLTALKVPKTGKSWELYAKIHSYDKQAIPAQIKTAWMDESSPPFRGYPIEVLSKFAEQSTFDEVNISNFSADIDFIQIAPDRVSKDGFFFGDVVDNKGELTVPFVSFNLGGTGEYLVQNGYAAFIYLQWHYFKFVAPAARLNINFEDVTPVSIRRTKIQRLVIPSLALSEPWKLIVSALGTGRVREYIDKRDETGGTLTIEHDI